MRGARHNLRFPRSAAAVMALLTAAAPTSASERGLAQVALQAQYPAIRFCTDGEHLTRVYGPAFGHGATPLQAAESFLRAYAGVFGVAHEDLSATGAQDVMNGKFTAVYYVQQYGGVPVDRAWLTLLVRCGRVHELVLASGRLFDLRTATLPPVALGPGAVRAALRARYPEFAFTQPELMVFAERDGERTRASYAYRLVGNNRDETYPEIYEFIVDAGRAEAAILELRSLVYYEDVGGRVTGFATPGERPDRPDNPPVGLPLKQLWVRIVDGNASLTNGAGQYVIAHDDFDLVTVETSLGGQGDTEAGPWVRVVNRAGDVLAMTQEVLPPGPVDFVFNDDPNEFGTAQVNGFMHTTLVHNFAKGINPSYPGLDIQIPCKVNIDRNCNALYDGSSLKFFRAGSGCPNTAYSSVIYHEYGHHIVAAGHPWAAYDYHEGMADATANLLMDTPCEALGFMGDDECLRDAHNSVSYPCRHSDPHVRGQSLSGALWLTRDYLSFTEPDDYLNIVRELYLNSILLRPAGIEPGIVVDLLTLDDDDSDITNGTPHYFEIVTAFGLKNLPAPAPLRFTYPHGRPHKLSPLGRTWMRVVIEAEGLVPEAGSARLHYSTGGTFAELALEQLSENVYDAVFPEFPCGTVVRYYISAA
ncbi:MAG: hypothetical protein KKB50_11155 [Planctomycetes bacterium]|nr:hypothetical protein [Planctomycetota bacterium]